MRDKTVAEWKAKVAKAEVYAEELEAENRELKETLERALTERSEVDVEKVIILGGLRDLANTSKYHTNAEWKRIVMRLTENAEDYANRVLAEARERTKTEQKGVDVDALLKLADELEDSATGHYLATRIRDAVKGLTHRKPDTQEAIEADATISPWEYCADILGIDTKYLDSEMMIMRMCKDLLKRQRKLLGGENHE